MQSKPTNRTWKIQVGYDPDHKAWWDDFDPTWTDLLHLVYDDVVIAHTVADAINHAFFQTGVEKMVVRHVSTELATASSPTGETEDAQ